jgi:outer membrane lipoprotein-sorting protein
LPFRRRLIYDAGRMRLRAFAVLLVLAALGTAAAAGETARQILDRRKALEDGPRHWNDRQERMKFLIVDRRGGERVRELDIYERRYPADEQKTILFFLAPAEVKGTGFLAFTHKGRPADQWLYLPELKRVRQITARTRNESFVGTDLSYHDLDIIQEMTSWTEDDAASSLKGEETVDGTATHVIELDPKREDIAYERIVLWLGRDDLVPRRLEFFADAAEPKKRIVQSEIKPVGQIPVAHRVEATTLASGTKTVIAISEVKFNQALEDDLFTQRYLERGER